MNENDIKGKKFGHWTAIELDTKKYKTRDKRWICRCDCGTEKSVLQKYLLSGKSKSCGCTKKKDLSGQRFGFLTVLETLYNYDGQKRAVYKCRCDCGNITYIKGSAIKKTLTCGQCNLLKDETGVKYGKLLITKMLYNYDEKNNTYCECLCDCGKTIIVKANHLHTGNTTSCGCKHSPSLIGNRYGKLTVIEEIKNDSPQRLWKCQCDCGNITYVKSYTLTSGHTTSCGCFHSEKFSKNEVFIASLLKSHNIEYQQEKSFDTCIGVGGRHLRFDFYLPAFNTCIEFDGKQHFIPIDYFGGNKNYERTKANDKIKNEFCMQKSIQLCRLNYMMSKEEIEEQILSIIQNPVTITA